MAILEPVQNISGTASRTLVLGGLRERSNSLCPFGRCNSVDNPNPPGKIRHMADFPKPSLTLVTERILYRPQNDKKGDTLSLIDAAIAGGVDIVQLRVRNSSPGDLGLYAVALRLREMTAGKALFVITGDVELAEKTLADGILLPERSYKPSDARSFLRGVEMVHAPAQDELHLEARLGGGVRLVGTFAHGVTGASRAERGGADYVQVGPAFDKDANGTSKSGLATVRKVKDAVHIPVIAFGGIATQAQAAACLHAGADGIAVTDAILQAPEPESATRALKSALEATWRELHS